MELNQQKIVTVVMREKKRLKDAKNSGIGSGGGDALVEATRRTAWTEFAMLMIKNRNVPESQQIDGRSSDQQLPGRHIIGCYG
jgi:hypothetical protein